MRGTYVFRPYPRTLESVAVCRCHYKGSTFFSVIKRPWVLVRTGFEPATSRPADRRSANWANQKRKNLCVKLWKWTEGQTNTSVEGAPYCLKKKLCGKTLVKQDRFTQNQKKKRRVCDTKSRNISFTSHVLRWACGSLSKTNRRFERTQFAQEIRKDPKVKKKKKISVTVTYLLNAKASRSKLSSMAELTWV